MNKNLPNLWNNILSTIDDKFLKSILEDIEHIEIGNMVATDIRIVFNTLESYNFFKIAIKKIALLVEKLKKLSQKPSEIIYQ
jgi:uncharacterized protein (UPF0335 family)